MPSVNSKCALPAELWVEIAEILQSRINRGARFQINSSYQISEALPPLKALASTSKTLLALIRPLLFSRLRFSRIVDSLGEDRDVGIGGAALRRYLARAKERIQYYKSAHTSVHVREICLNGPPYYDDTYLDPAHFRAHAKITCTVLDALECFTRLHKLTIQRWGLSEENMQALSVLNGPDMALSLDLCTYHTVAKPVQIPIRRLIIDGHYKIDTRSVAPAFVPTQHLTELETDHDTLVKWADLLNSFPGCMASVKTCILHLIAVHAEWGPEGLSTVWPLFQSLTTLTISLEVVRTDDVSYTDSIDFLRLIGFPQANTLQLLELQGFVYYAEEPSKRHWAESTVVQAMRKRHSDNVLFDNRLLNEACAQMHAVLRDDAVIQFEVLVATDLITREVKTTKYPRAYCAVCHEDISIGGEEDVGQ